MRIKFFTINLLFFYSILCSAQKNVIVVIDSVSSLPISFARFSSNSGSLYTDIDGKVEKHKLKSTTYNVISIGYNTKKVKISTTTDTIFLTPANYDLKEFKLGANSAKAYEIGYHKHKFFFHITDFVIKPIQVLFLPPQKNSTTIEEIILDLGRVKKGFEYRVYLFGVDEKGYPSDTIFAKNVLHNSNKNFARINVREQHIIMPTNGIFLGYSWLVNERNPPSISNPTTPRKHIYRITMTHKIKKIDSFYFSDGIWRKNIPLYSDGPNKPTYINYRFGLKVKPF